MLATALATAIRARVGEARFAGIGGERMHAAGMTLCARTDGWASVGPLEALGKIPKLSAVVLRLTARLIARPVDLIVLVDFGAFNLRFAQTLRNLGYRGPILYFVPPGAWFDDARKARRVRALAEPLTPFVHQRDFYRSLGLEIAWYGHPLRSIVPVRDPRPPAPDDGGTIALLPGSRRAELQRHVPRLLIALERLRLARPRARFVVGAADGEATARIRAFLRAADVRDVELLRGARAALDVADAAFVASGTAVLEAALLGVPTVAHYVLSAGQAKIFRRIWSRPYITLPNILLDRMAVPEVTQEAALPERLAAQMEAVLHDPGPQSAAFAEMRALLGPTDALDRCAEHAIALARAGAG